MVCTYEPVLTKSFRHGRTEAMRPATVEAKNFFEAFTNKSTSDELKQSALRTAIQTHSQLVKECARGKGVDRHLFALSQIARRRNEDVPFFESKAWRLLNYTILSTSNCGNPSLRLFGFGPVVPDGFGIGYIIKDRSIYYSISSKHRQTKRYAQNLESSLRGMAALFHSKKKSHYSKNSSSTRANSVTFQVKNAFTSLVGDEIHDNDDAYGDLWGISESTSRQNDSKGTGNAPWSS